MKYLAILFLVMLGGQGYGQTNRQNAEMKDLYKQIAALDSALFDAFNTCDLKKFESFFSDDAEFYHDKGGLMVGKKAITEPVKNNICGKVTRMLVKESLEVYPIPNHGAIQAGSHRFKNKAEGQTEFGRPMKFLHIWQLKDGNWKITRVVSYDH